jgi:hypothetical protein
MSDDRTRDLLDRFFRHEIGPIEAADELITFGEFTVGSAVDHTIPAQSEDGKRFQALLGRLSWVFLQRAAAQELPACNSVEEYRDFFLRCQELADEES